MVLCCEDMCVLGTGSCAGGHCSPPLLAGMWTGPGVRKKRLWHYRGGGDCVSQVICDGDALGLSTALTLLLGLPHIALHCPVATSPLCKCLARCSSQDPCCGVTSQAQLGPCFCSSYIHQGALFLCLTLVSFDFPDSQFGKVGRCAIIWDHIMKVSHG